MHFNKKKTGATQGKPNTNTLGGLDLADFERGGWSEKFAMFVYSYKKYLSSLLLSWTLQMFLPSSHS